MATRGWWIAGVVLLAGGMSREALGNPDLGRWGPVIFWSHVPVSAFTYTYAATWNPETGTFQEVAHPCHDLFCGHYVMLDDGSVFSNGGQHCDLSDQPYQSLDEDPADEPESLVSEHRGPG
jgi:hypothetical protein